MENLDKKLTPLMKQYWDIKSAHADKIVFFRMGDFYELFDQDAITAAPILGIALTARNKNHGDNTAMCGMPHHSVHNYINKLLALNYKVAICDQVEDPKEAKGLVKRAITRVLSPGMVYDPETLEATQSNYLAAYDDTTLAFLESTTGEAFYVVFKNQDERQTLISVLNPTELVLEDSQHKNELSQKKDLTGPCLSEHAIKPDALTEEEKKLPLACQRLLSYAISMQGEKIRQTLESFKEKKLQKRMEISSQVLAHLEVFETYSGQKQGSLFYALNKTQSAAGARKLKNWMLFPLTDVSDIQGRQRSVEFWMKDLGKLKELRRLMAQMGDIERRLGKISNPNCNARDLISLKDSLETGLHLSNLAQLPIDAGFLKDLIARVGSTIREDAPLSTQAGHMIREGFSKELDHLISLSTNSQKLLSELEAREKEATQISSLKVRYNQVFGYYIEVTKTHTDKVPLHYVRKQTLTNAERYITDELQKLESEILSAQAKRSELESYIFESLRTYVLKVAPQLLELSHHWSELDVQSSLAWLALEHSYCKPEFSESRVLKLEGSRHAVVEQLVSFVPNSIEMQPGGCLLLTGPNMAGKSTLMRQIALTAMMAQMGSFVPAQKAQLPVFDSVFTRIGASDMMSEGLSTFMVEMKETAYLLKHATSKSLVVLDEIGRGTSTYDGMSLAQAILVYLVTKIRAFSLFATHYHELTTLVAQFPQIQNAHMRVGEKTVQGQKEIQFLYTLESGPANKSYGIEVARLAGMPAEVTVLAKKVLDSKEKSRSDEALPLFAQVESVEEASVVDVTNPLWEKIILDISKTSIATTSPIDALNKIHQWQKDLN